MDVRSIPPASPFQVEMANHPSRRKWSHVAPNGAPVIMRLQKRIQKDLKTKCHIYTGAVDTHGYGYIVIKGKTKKAHRTMWEIVNKQKIPKGKHVLHRCDRPSCINPDHLWLGTPLDNARDCISKGRQHHECGNQRYNAKLTPALVRKIRKYKGNQRALARQLGISQGTLRSALTRRSWKHVK